MTFSTNQTLGKEEPKVLRVFYPNLIPVLCQVPGVVTENGKSLEESQVVITVNIVLRRG